MTKSADRKSKKRPETIEAPVTWRWILANIFSLARQFGGILIWATVVVVCVRFAAQAAAVFAGRTSIEKLMVDVAAHLNTTVSLSISLAGATSLMWFLEFRRHRKTRERLTARITMLEKEIDPNRTSSLLTTEGMTQKGDR